MQSCLGGSRVDSGLGLWGGGLEQQESQLRGVRWGEPGWLPGLCDLRVLGKPFPAQHPRGGLTTSPREHLLA